MAVFKCKMCGGSLEIGEDISVAECEYCGSKQTVPTKKDEIVANLYNRANNLRLKNEFDKAAEIYNKILNENDADAEAHWGMVLCKYGIEYIEDSKSYKRVPTCHRTQYQSVLTDADYLAAIESADGISKEVYIAEAHEIAELQKSILAIVKSEKPFDVFICYKETDEKGRRTVDSALANDIYYQLTQEGFRVFYSAITLEDKLGVEYEPYIFAALNSARVMLVIGTKPEYFNAVWVKNEWSRYLGIMKNEREKLLIPCYRDMDAYDLPEEFAHLQAQDMSKIGFINDLVRGIKKIIVKDEPKIEKEIVVQQVGAAGNIQALLKRGAFAIEDHEWDRADGFFEEVLNLDAECAEAYVGKFLAGLKVSSLKVWADTLYERYFGKDRPIASVKLIMKIDQSLIKEKADKYFIPGYFSEEEFIKQYKKIEITYERHLDDVAKKEEALENNLKNNLFVKAKRFAKGELADSIENTENELLAKIKKCREEAVEKDKTELQKAKETLENQISELDAKNDRYYEQKIEEREKDYIECCERLIETDNIDELRKLSNKFTKFGDFKESMKKREQCIEKERIETERKAQRKAEAERNRIEKERIEAEKKAQKEAETERNRIERERRRKKIGIISVTAGVTVALIVVVVTVMLFRTDYNKAVEMMNLGQYGEAIAAFEKLGKYSDSAEKIKECNYNKAAEMMNLGQNEGAIAIFEELGDYSDSVEKIKECNYNEAVEMMNLGQNEEAIVLFEELGDYSDSTEKIKECNYNEAVEMMNLGQNKEAIAIFKELGDYLDSVEKVKECNYNEAVEMMNLGRYEEAIVIFTRLGDYSDSAEKVKEYNYDKAVELLDLGYYEEAIAAFTELGEYSDSTEKIKESKDRLVQADYDHAMICIEQKRYDEAYEKLLSVSGYKDAKDYLEKFYSVPSEIKAQSGTVTYDFSYTEKGLISEVYIDQYGERNEFNFDEQGRVESIEYGESYSYQTVNYVHQDDGTVLETTMHASGKTGSQSLYDMYGNKIAYTYDGEWKYHTPKCDDFNNQSYYESEKSYMMNEYDQNQNLVQIRHRVYNLIYDTEIRYTYLYLEDGKIDKDLLWKNLRVICSDNV